MSSDLRGENRIQAHRVQASHNKQLLSLKSAKSQKRRDTRDWCHLAEGLREIGHVAECPGVVELPLPPPLAPGPATVGGVIQVLAIRGDYQDKTQYW